MKYVIKQYDDIKARVEEMSAEELLLAVICPDVSAEDLPDKRPSSMFFYTTTAEKARVASRNVNGSGEGLSLIVSDMEYGAANVIIGATVFPSMRAAAESGDEKLAYNMGVVAAKEARDAGYHWTFGPCVDILGNSHSPAVAYRTAGDNADTVITYGGAYMEGLQDNGLIATLKHFPGDGYCVEDQHVTTAENPLSKEEWDNSFGRVYSCLIQRGAMAIMPGHISLPAYDTPDKNGLYPPATASKKLLTELLREKLGFEGIIVSDAVNMGGFCGYMNLYDAEAAFLEAGGDCLLFQHGTDEFISEMKKRIAEGKLSMETLKNRAFRMLCFVREYFERHSVDEKVSVDKEFACKTAMEITTRAVKKVRDRKNVLPLNFKGNEKIAHVIINNVWGEISVTEEMTSKLKSYAETVDVYHDAGPGALLNMAKNGGYDLIVCSVLEAPSWGINTSKLSGPAARNMMNGWMRYGTNTVFVSYNSPSFGKTYNSSVDILVETYGIESHTVDSVLKLIFK